MKTLQWVVLLMAASSLVGCKATFHVQNYQAPANKIRPDDAIFIIVPPDAYDEPRSGQICADTLQEAFRPYANRIKQSDEVASLSVYLTNAADQGFTYLLDSKIYRWEEEPTEWTGKSDFLDICLRLLHTPDGVVVSETRFDGKSKWATFGGDHVEHLLNPLASEWVRAMYEGTDFKAPTPETQKKH